MRVLRNQFLCLVLALHPRSMPSEGSVPNIFDEVLLKRAPGANDISGKTARLIIE